MKKHSNPELFAQIQRSIVLMDGYRQPDMRKPVQFLAVHLDGMPENILVGCPPLAQKQDEIGSSNHLKQSCVASQALDFGDFGFIYTIEINANNPQYQPQEALSTLPTGMSEGEHHMTALYAGENGIDFVDMKMCVGLSEHTEGTDMMKFKCTLELDESMPDMPDNCILFNDHGECLGILAYGEMISVDELVEFSIFAKPGEIQQQAEMILCDQSSEGKTLH